MKKLLARFVRQSPAMVVAMVALFVALSGTAVATTSALITGKQIKNNSITGLDIKNKSIAIGDLATRARGARGVRGVAGPPGPVGPQGAQGPTGTVDTSNFYDKAASDARFAPFPSVIRGVWLVVDTATGGGQGFSEAIEFGSTLSAAPTVHLIPPAGAPPVGCSGTVGAPNAAPGHLCIFQRNQTNVSTFAVCSATNACPGASPFGAYFVVFSTAAGLVDTGGSYAVRPSALSTSASSVVAQGGNSRSSGE